MSNQQNTTTQTFVPDYTLEDLEASEVMLKNSLFSLLPAEQASIEWQRVTLEAQFSDIHLEEL